MELGKYSTSLRNSETNVQLPTDEKTKPNQVSPDAKVSTVAKQTLVGKENANHTNVNGKKRPTFIGTSTTLKALVKSVGNLFAPKIPKNAANEASQKTNTPHSLTKQHSFTSRKERKESVEKENFLDKFNDILATHTGSPRNKETVFKQALSDTLTALRKADKAGTLDENLYALVTHRLKSAFADKRQSVNLDDESPPTVHQQLVQDLKADDPLRQNLERHAMTNELSRAVNKSASSESDKKTQKELVKQACAAFPPVTENTVEVGGTKYTTLLLPNAQNGHDLLIKGKKLGDGGESIVFKAHSLRDQKDVAVIYAKDNKNGSEEKENAKQILEELGIHKGIQGPMQLVVLKTPEADKPVLITDILEEGDFEKYLISEKLFTTLPPNIITDLKDYFKAPGPKAEKLEKLNNFSQNYRELLAANYDTPQVDKLFKHFESLINKSPEIK